MIPPSDASPPEETRYEELYAELLFVDKPTINVDKIVANWSEPGRWSVNGYQCERSNDRDGAMFFFKGGCAVLIYELQAIDPDDYPPDYPTTATVVDRDTWLIDHERSFAAFKRCRYALPIQVRVMKEEGVFALLNETLICIAGIRETLAVECVWLDHAGMFVAMEDFDEYASYLKVSDGTLGTDNPDPLYFGIRVRSTSPIVEAYTRGVARFLGAELAVSLATDRPIDAVATLFNTARYAIAGNHFKAGETMQFRDYFFRFVDELADDTDDPDESPRLRMIREVADEPQR